MEVPNGASQYFYKRTKGGENNKDFGDTFGLYLAGDFFIAQAMGKEAGIMKLNKLNLRCIVLNTLLLIFIVSGISVAYAYSSEVKFGAIISLSGSGAYDAERVKQGLELAVNEINQRGGILGQKIELIIYDDKTVPAEGVSCVKRLITRDNVHAIISGFFSSITLAEQPVIQEVKMPWVNPIAMSPVIRQKSIKSSVSIHPTNDMVADVYAKFIIDKFKPKTVCFLANNDDYGRFEVSAYEKRWKEMKGPETIDKDYFAADTTDFEPFLSKIKFRKPDIFYLVASAVSTLGTSLRQAKALKLEMPILIAGGCLKPDAVKIAEGGAEGRYGTSPYLPSFKTPGNPKFVETFKKNYNEEPMKLHALAYSAVYLLSNAMKEAKSTTDREKIADALRNNSWHDGPLGKLTFNDQGQAQFVDKIVVVKKGEIVEVD